MSTPSHRSLRVRASFLAAALFGSVGAGCVFYVEEDASCGKNAYSYSGDCFCEDGYIGSDPWVEGCSPAVTFLITDDCDDDYDVLWKLFSDDREWTWPAGDAVYVTPGYVRDQYETIECNEGEWICFGGQTDGGLVYGVGLDNAQSCDNCCYPCESATHDLGYLTCN